jgi:hypothetical protein
MIFPVRVNHDLKPTLAADRVITLADGHPIALNLNHLCPACDLMFEAGSEIVLVFCGISPQDRKPYGAVNGATIPVHRYCALGN